MQMQHLSTTQQSDLFGILINELVSKPNRSQRVPDFSNETSNSGPITRAVFPYSQILIEVISPFIIQHLKNKWLKGFVTNTLVILPFQKWS